MRGWRHAWVVFAAFVEVLAVAAPAIAQDLSLVTTLVHANTRENLEDRFGSGVAVSGGTLFVGAKNEAGANDYSGAVHVFSDKDWSEVARLQSSVDADIEFGAAIRLDGDRALISNAAIDRGVIWIFEKVGGAWTQKLRVQGVVDEAFGYRLALRGDFAFVAAPRVGTGKVHVYRRMAETWSAVQVLTASDAQDEDFFGYSLAFDGARLAVAAPGNLLGPKRSGVYTFSRQGDAFVEDGKLAGGDPAANWFGADVGVSRDTLIVNAPPAYQVMSGGKALVYERRGEQWELDRELTVTGEASFPQGLVVDGDTAWFGARTSDPGSLNVHAFRHVSGDWQQGQKLSFPVLGMYEIASWTVQDGTFAIGFWNGLRTESVQVHRSAGHGSSSGGGGSSGGAADTTTGGTNAGGTAGENTAGARAGSASITSGGSAQGGAPVTDGGSGCAVAPSNARAWPFAALAFAVALARKRRTRRAHARCAS